MPLMGSASQQHGYACRCLNVRVHPHPPPGPPPTTDKDYDSVYVGDDGLSVTHIQVTLRTRTRPVQEKTGDATCSTRYTSLTCLLCQTPVYRVHQIVHPDVEEAEGPVLPTDEWAEQDMLKSTSGWIEVYKGCLTGDAILQAESLPQYSKLFSILLPAETTVPMPAGAPESEHKSAPQLSGPYLPSLPPLFEPPPFTPSHPAFVRLSSLAIAESEKIRTAAEEYIAQVAQEKVAEIQVVELALKHKVELLWSKFNEGADKAEDETSGNHPSTRRRHSSIKQPRFVHGLSADYTAPDVSSVRVNDFVPIHNLAPRTSPAAAFHKVASALSASLVSSSFRHPRAQGSPPAYGSGPSSPSRSSITHVKTPSIASSRTAASAANGDATAMSIREAFRRNMDEAMDVATSFRYVMDMDTLMEGSRGRQDSDSHTANLSLTNENRMAESSTAAAARAKSPKAGKSSIKKPKEVAKPTSPTHDEPPATTSETAEDDHAGGRHEKGKRKVTFVVKPEVTIIEGEAQQAEPAKAVNEEAIFDMESEGGERKDNGPLDAPMPLSFKSPTIPDFPRTQRRTSRGRKSNDFGPVSFTALRPASLPTYSAIRPPIARPEPAPTEAPHPQPILEPSAALAEASNGQQVNGSNGTHGSMSSKEGSDDDENVGLREAEILRLVAAGTPSHRNAWKKNSKAWQLFVNRNERRLHTSRDAIAEEEEGAVNADYAPRGQYPERSEDESEDDDDDDGEDEGWKHHGIASSLPIPIGRPNFGLPSYQPKVSSSDRPGMLEPVLHKVSSVAMRHAAYAERDRSRSIDPGALDFIADEEDEEEEEDINHDTDLQVESKGRERAFQILKARNKLPAAGMWRSLA